MKRRKADPDSQKLFILHLISQVRIRYGFINYPCIQVFITPAWKVLLVKAEQSCWKRPKIDLYLSSGLSLSDFSLQVQQVPRALQAPQAVEGRYIAEAIVPLMECVLSLFAEYEKVAFNTCCPFLSRALDLLWADNDFSTLTAYSFSDIQDRKSYFQQFQKQWSETTAVRNDSITQTS